MSTNGGGYEEMVAGAGTGAGRATTMQLGHRAGAGRRASSQSRCDRARGQSVMRLPPLALCLVAVLVLAALVPAARGALLPLDAERLRASVGGYAVMNCHLDFPFGNEIPYHLQWDKDGEMIFSWYSGGGEGGEAAGARAAADRWGGRVRRVQAARALGLGRGSVNVSAVRETDAGLYRCRVTFPNRSPPARNNGTFYYLDVDGGNLIATPPMNVTVREGERAELECLPKSPESVVQWERDGAPLDATPELAARRDPAANGSLVLRSAASSDPGEYACRVRDPAGRTQSASAFLDVQYAAKVVYAPKERHLPLGKPASLDCHFSANPPLTNLRWEKDGFLFDPYNVPGVFYSRNGSLLFNRVDESHEGQYSCTPYNALGTAGPSPRVRVRVLRPPALQARPLPLYVARLGATLTLPCALQPSSSQEPDAAPAPLWTRKDGAPLPAGRHSTDAGSLTIVDVTSADRGVYSCSATNDAATVSADTELLVENVPPRAPRRLRAEPAQRSVHLSWEPGESGLEMEYIVWYRERAASEWRTMKILSRGVTEATVGGLRAGAEYELRVLSQDAIGDGLFSKPIFVSTQGAEDADAPPERETTPAPAEAVEAALDGGAPPPAPLAPDEPRAPDELEVSVRLLEEGALVRWRRADGDRAPCAVRWYRGDQLLEVTHTEHDYMLVSVVEEQAQYWARVACARGAGGATLQVPAWGRLRAAAGACAGAALLLAALAAALYAARRRLRLPRRAPKCAR